MIRVIHTNPQPVSPVVRTRTQGFVSIEPVRGQVVGQIVQEHADGSVSGASHRVVQTDPILQEPGSPESPYEVRGVSTASLTRLRAAIDEVLGAWVTCLKEGGVIEAAAEAEIPSYAELHPEYAERWKDELKPEQKASRKLPRP